MTGLLLGSLARSSFSAGGGRSSVEGVYTAALDIEESLS